MDLPESQEQFEQEPMGEQTEEQNTPAVVSVSSSDPKPVPASESQIPTDLPPVETIVEDQP